MKKYDAELVLRGDDIVGEGPVWSEKEQSLYWIDILGKKLHRWKKGQALKQTFDLPSYIGCFALGDDGLIYLMLEDGMYSMVPSSGDMTYISKPDDHMGSHRFNDGKCDSSGRFYVASMSNDLNGGGGDKVPTSSLYFVDCDAKFTKVIDRAFVIPNGLAWNDVLKKFYHIDSVTGDVTAYDYDMEKGTLNSPNVIIHFDGGQGVPDGMSIDNDGNLWIAHWGGGRLSHWNPHTGTKIGEIHVPCSNVTSCTFGGTDNKVLYITTAAVDDQSDLAGSLFSVSLDVGGPALGHYRTGVER